MLWFATLWITATEHPKVLHQHQLPVPRVLIVGKGTRSQGNRAL